MNNTLHFDGSQTYIEVPGLEAPSKSNYPITIEFWNKADGGTNGYTVWFETTDPTVRVSCHAPWGDGTFYWDCGSPVESHGRLSFDYADYIGKWTHVALVSGDGRKGRRMGLYLNGEFKAGSDNVVFPMPDGLTSGLLIGGRKKSDGTIDSSTTHRGTIDELRIWKIARTEQDIRRDMNAQLCGDEEGLVASFNFNWGFRGYQGKNWWGEALTTLPNAVKGSPPGALRGFGDTSWISSDVTLRGPVEPVFDFRSAGSNQFLTAAPAERDECLKEGAGWRLDARPDRAWKFAVHRTAAPGTTPLYRLKQKNTGLYRLATGPAERARLDKRQLSNVADTSSDWVDDGVLGFVATSKAVGGVALYRILSTDGIYTYSLNDTGAAGIECYVLPDEDSTYTPTPISFKTNGLSENVWYVLQNQGFTGRAGLQVDSSGVVQRSMIPATGSYTAFQWRLDSGRLVNRATGRALTVLPQGLVSLDPATAGSDLSSSQQLTLTNIPLRGTDCFTISSDGFALAYTGTLPKTVALDATQTSQQWTLVATELCDGYSIPGPPPQQASLPFSKYLDATGVRVLGTGTVSDWAMLRTKLIVDNMLAASKGRIDVATMKDAELYVVSRDDSAADIARTHIGVLQGEKAVAELRGGAHSPGMRFCFVSEEMMWKKGVFTRNDNARFRKFDQVVHEFMHLVDSANGLNRGKSFPDTNDPGEEIAGKTQGWFDSVAQPDSAGLYAAGTRDDLRSRFPSHYAYLAECFDPTNTWRPPLEIRSDPGLNLP